MNASTARKLSLLTMGSIVVMGAGKSMVVDETMPPAKFWIACGFSSFALATFADLNPGLAGPACLLIFTVVLFEEGLPFIQKMLNYEVTTVSVTDAEVRESASKVVNQGVDAAAGSVQNPAIPHIRGRATPRKNPQQRPTKERLFANPSRPNSYQAGGANQLRYIR